MSEFVKATIDDISQIAKIHKNAFSDLHFTSFLSIDLLTKYYELFIADDSEIWLLNDESANIDGFIVFGENLNEKIQKFKSDYQLDIFKTAISNPAVTVKKLLSNLYYRFISRPDSFKESSNLILSIAVNSKGKGTGHKLLTFVNEYNIKNKIENIGLYVRVDSTYAVNFYLKNDYKIVGFTSGLFYMEKQISLKV